MKRIESGASSRAEESDIQLSHSKKNSPVRRGQ